MSPLKSVIAAKARTPAAKCFSIVMIGFTLYKGLAFCASLAITQAVVVLNDLLN